MRLQQQHRNNNTTFSCPNEINAIKCKAFSSTFFSQVFSTLHSNKSREKRTLIGHAMLNGSYLHNTYRTISEKNEITNCTLKCTVSGGRSHLYAQKVNMSTKNSVKLSFVLRLFRSFFFLTSIFVVDFFSLCFFFIVNFICSFVRFQSSNARYCKKM